MHATHRCWQPYSTEFEIGTSALLRQLFAEKTPWTH